MKHSKFSRRTLLKGAGALMGSTALAAPAVHAQEPKVLRYLGTAVNQSTEIAKKVKEDTGITIEYIPVTTDCSRTSGAVNALESSIWIV